MMLLDPMVATSDSSSFDAKITRASDGVLLMTIPFGTSSFAFSPDSQTFAVWCIRTLLAGPQYKSGKFQIKISSHLQFVLSSRAVPSPSSWLIYLKAQLLRDHDRRRLPSSLARRQDRRRFRLWPVEMHHEIDQIVGRR